MEDILRVISCDVTRVAREMQWSRSVTNVCKSRHTDQISLRRFVFIFESGGNGGLLPVAVHILEASRTAFHKISTYWKWPGVSLQSSQKAF